MKTTTITAALVLALSGTALGQEAGDPFVKAMDGAPPVGVRSGAPRVPAAPVTPQVPQAPGVRASGTTAPNPLDDLSREARRQTLLPVVAVPADGGGMRAVAVPSDSAGPAGPAQDAPDPGVEISANYDVTMDIYQKILEAQGLDTSQLDRRIASNEEIVARYSPEMNKNEDELRKSQVGFMNRAFQLRQQRETGQMSEEAFRRAIIEEEGRWNRTKGAIAGDAAFYREEVEQAQMRAAQLKAQKVATEQRLEREGKAKPKPKPPGEALFEGLNGTLDRLWVTHTHFTMDGGARCTACNGVQADGDE